MLSSCTTMCSFEVKVSPHTSLNTSKGVISASEFIDDTEETLIENLKDQKVISVRRIRIRRDDKLIPTKHLILTFNQPKIPPSIKLAWYNYPVRHYIPNPLRCFQCQKFGHSRASCRGQLTCARCSVAGHMEASCKVQPFCINCKGNHAAFSRNCPKWSQEKEIQSVKVLQNLTFIEARRIVTARTPRPGVSYSAAAKVSFCSVSTQTDIPVSSQKLQSSIQKPKFNFTNPSTKTLRTTSPPPTKTSKIDGSEKARPFPKQPPTKKLFPIEKPGLSRKKKDPKYVQ
ncbi:uncharacterized protein [Parasteatoda tepidariorum]|uniref:uncharacterized protein n=1 Tax=Parasteatoda tepidariorum TaxID=114398 RepID=UPI001C723073|nr:uncharacterized protein LOC107451652 [Parasteatoda tepidariorum]